MSSEDKLQLQWCCLLYMLIVTVFQCRFSDLCSQSGKGSYFNFLKHIYFKRQNIKNTVKCLHNKKLKAMMKTLFFISIDLIY